jgi:hypothetical protein
LAAKAWVLRGKLLWSRPVRNLDGLYEIGGDAQRPVLLHNATIKWIHFAEASLNTLIMEDPRIPPEGLTTGYRKCLDNLENDRI